MSVKGCGAQVQGLSTIPLQLQRWMRPHLLRVRQRAMLCQPAAGARQRPMLCQPTAGTSTLTVTDSLPRQQAGTEQVREFLFRAYWKRWYTDFHQRLLNNNKVSVLPKIKNKNKKSYTNASFSLKHQQHPPPTAIPVHRSKVLFWVIQGIGAWNIFDLFISHALVCQKRWYTEPTQIGDRADVVMTI